MSIGQRIGELRKSHGYSQEYVAEQLNISRQAVSKWEQDLSAPDTYNLIALAELLGVSVEYLATGKTASAAPEPPSAAPASNALPSSLQDGRDTQRIVGLILLSAGLLSLILGLLFSRLLVALSILLLLFGTLTLAVRRHLGLVLLWISVLIAFFGTTPLTRPQIVGEGPNGGVTVRSMIHPVFCLFALGVLIYTVVKIVQGRKQKRHNKTDK